MTRTLGLVVAIAVLALIIIFAGPAACNKIRSMGAQSRVQQGQSEALSNSAKDAIATQGSASARETASEALSRSNEKDIRNAPGANDPVNAASRDAGHRALCVRNAYRDSERCRLLLARPR